MKRLRSWKHNLQVLALRDLGLAHSPRMRRLLETSGALMARLGRPPSPHKTRHVMINMRDEWYLYMRKNNMNMSEEINKYLEARFNLKICPTCYMDELVHRQCDNCLGDAIFCNNKECTDYKTRVGNSCPSEMYFGKMQPTCTAAQFYGKDG